MAQANCTWEKCPEVATVPQTAKDGEMWANLCQAHHDELEASINRLFTDPGRNAIKRHLRDWIKAQGGSKAAAKRMSGLLRPKS